MNKPTRRRSQSTTSAPFSLSALGFKMYCQRNGRFLLLVFGIIFFFGCHNYLQEYIMSLDGFESLGVFLGYLEVLGTTLCTAIERQYTKDLQRRSSWMSYIAICFCLLVSSATSNIALGYINYPTKVVFRSCKLIPTMIIAALYLGKKLEKLEYIFGLCISTGMILFAAADFRVSPRFDPLGITLVSISVVADAFLPNLQEKVFDAGSSRVEVTYYSNLLCLIAYTISFSSTGDIQDGILFAYNSR